MKDRTWGLLASETRRRILIQLGVGEQTVSELIEALKVAQPTMSEHLAELRRFDLISWRQDGPFRRYSINEEGVAVLKKRYDELWKAVTG